MIKFKRLGTHDLPLPSKATTGAAGIDMRAAEDVVWTNRQVVDGWRHTMVCHIATVDFGFAMEIPQGFVALCYIRSGLGMKHNVTLRNSVGVIDSDYRGPMKAMLICHAPIPPTIRKGDRICQLVVQQVEDFSIVEVDELSETERGAGGFGSTGVK
jgi:dUTP pyrophosphatase